jgi:carbon monoxide dehydrogenase subunit G
MSANAPSTVPAPPETAADVPLLVFVHIRKTAGKTLRQILYRNYTRSRTRLVRNYFVAPEISLNVIKDLATAAPSNLRAIHGHFLFWPDIEWPENTQFLTLLRDPVERVISHYYWLRARSQRFGKTLEDTVVDGAIHDNLQTRVLSAQMPPFGQSTDEMLEAAVRGMDRMDVVGLTERFDESLVLATRTLGWRRMLYRRENVTPDRKPTDEISPKVIDLIKERNLLDLELYRLATERFEREIENHGDEFAIEVEALKRANERAASQPEDAPLQPLAPTIAGPNGSPGGTLDLREALVEAQAQLLERDAAVERLISISTPRAAARVATRERKSDNPLVNRKAALEEAKERARSRVEAARQEIRELEQQGGAQSEPKLEALRQTEAMAAKRLEGFERRSQKLEGRITADENGGDEPDGAAPPAAAVPGRRPRKNKEGRVKKQRAAPGEGGTSEKPRKPTKVPKAAKADLAERRTKTPRAAPAKQDPSDRIRTAEVVGTRRFNGLERQPIWDMLERPDQIANLIPSVQSFEVGDESHWTASVKIPLRSPIQLKCEKSDERPPEHGRLTVSGRGAGSTVKIDASFDLVDKGGTTDVSWRLDVELTGALASMGNRVLQMLVRKQMRTLFAALEEELARPGENPSS